MKENSIKETIKTIEKMIKSYKEADECGLSNNDFKNEIKELKEKYNKDTHTLQNQLDIANADRIEKDKIIDLMANFMNKRSWKEHQVKDDICWCCKIEYASEECVKCIKQYFKKKVGN